MLQPVFESAIVKIQDRRVESLTEEEKRAVSLLKTRNSVPIIPNGANLSFAEQALKKRRIGTENGALYMDTHFLLPTSNICERLFSKAGHALSDRRGRIMPSNFEEQIFLHVNSDLWGISDVSKSLSPED